jgi:hypothetical protein
MKKIAFVAVLIVAIVFGIVAYSFAASQAVTVNASVNPKLEMTLSDGADVELGSIDPEGPGTLSTAGPAVTVKSNKTYNFGTNWTTNPGGAFSDTYADTTGAPKSASDVYNGNVVFTPSWLLEGSQVGVITFTANQQ